MFPPGEPWQRGDSFSLENGWKLMKFLCVTGWPSGLRRQIKALFRKGVGSNPTLVTFLRGLGNDHGARRCIPEHVSGRFKSKLLPIPSQRLWGSGSLQAFQACDPGSTPGERIFFSFSTVSLSFSLLSPRLSLLFSSLNVHSSNCLAEISLLQPSSPCLSAPCSLQKVVLHPPESSPKEKPNRVSAQ